MSTRTKSESGASMSKYDVEVEQRLQSLEEKVNMSNNVGTPAEDRLSALEAKLDDLICKLSRKMSL